MELLTLSPLWRGFFDDAAVFPPGSAPLHTAVGEHLRRRRTEASSLVGPLLLPMAEVRRAAELVPDGESPLEIGIIVPEGSLALAVRIAAEVGSRVRVVGYETRLPSAEDALAFLDAAAGLAGEASVSIEVDLEQVRGGVAELLADRDMRLKFRTGGMTADAFPTVDELAEVIVAAVMAGVPFKLTAGLHEPIRHHAASTGFTHHGFLNIAAATAAARAGRGRDRVAALLAATESTEILAAIASPNWRAGFTSFGTCSIIEPVDGLIQLGLADPDILREERT
jgi:hypothetical protein